MKDDIFDIELDDDSLTCALDHDDKITRHFACAMLVQRRGDVDAARRILDPHASDAQREVAFVRGLFHLRDARCAAALRRVIDSEDETYEDAHRLAWCVLTELEPHVRQESYRALARSEHSHVRRAARKALGT